MFYLLWRDGRAACPGPGAILSFDEHLHRAPDEALPALGMDAPPHQRDEDSMRRALQLVRHLLPQSAASVPRRGEKMNAKALS